MGNPPNLTHFGKMLSPFSTLITDEVAKLTRELGKFAKRQAVSSVTLEYNTAPYYWFSLWMRKHQPIENPTDVIVMEYTKGPVSSDRYPRSNEEDPNPAVPVPILVPNEGYHFFKYKDRLFWLDKKDDRRSYNRQGAMFVVSTFGQSTAPLEEIIAMGRQYAIEEQKEMLNIMLPSDRYSETNWVLGAQQLKRPINSVSLAAGEMENLMRDMEEFMAARDWYRETSVPYKRGYLLYGPAGTGKTSTIMALASHFGMSLYCLQLSEKHSDRHLLELVSKVPSGNMLLCEDIDSAMPERAKKPKKGPKKVAKEEGADEEEEGAPTSTVTFSGLLNVLDGALSSPGRILFMTTNHRERLDPALIRPGRVDYELEVGFATTKQAVDIYSRFFPARDIDEAQAYGSLVGNRGVSMATIQGHLLMHRKNPILAIDTAGELKNKTTDVEEAA